MSRDTTSSSTRRLRARLAASVLALTVPVFSHLQPAQAQVSVSITLAPPELPVYQQPPIPDDGYIWTPGYWAWGDDGYYWVPGTWVEPPQVGYLWTPGYWGWNNGYYAWQPGYWGTQIGFYGGVNYGWGYGGSGYDGGHWDHDHFSYNRSVNNFGSTHITNVYNKTVIVNNTSHVSYNGGTGGLHARPTAAEAAVAHGHHIGLTSEQTRHIAAARQDPSLRASVNHGRPAVLATSHAGVLRPSSAAAPAHAATVHTAIAHTAAANGSVQHHQANGSGASAQHSQRAVATHPAHHQTPVHHQAAVHPQGQVHHQSQVYHQAPVHHQAMAPRPVPHPAPHAEPRPAAHVEEHGPEKKK